MFSSFRKKRSTDEKRIRKLDVGISNRSLGERIFLRYGHRKVNQTANNMKRKSVSAVLQSCALIRDTNFLQKIPIVPY